MPCGICAGGFSRDCPPNEPAFRACPISGIAFTGVCEALPTSSVFEHGIMLRPVYIARIFFILLATACGNWVSSRNGGSPLNTAILAFILSTVIVIFECSLRTVSSKRLFLASLGLLFGLLISSMVYETIPLTVVGTAQNARIICNFLFGYLGMIIALKHADQMNLGDLKFIVSNPNGGVTRIVDTSVIIDGRIKELIVNGFVTGAIIVPTFVIDELQTLADSADSIKRTKGRRGLDILENLQAEHQNLQIVEKDFPDIRDVDRKLIEMAKEIHGQIVTNDFNLQKVATLHKVPVLNLNELADMLKPSVFVGETFKLMMTREGKEPAQAVGYLKDGTMVVVDEARDRIGVEIDIVVSSILQTNTGRMVFARPCSNEPPQVRKAS